MNKKLSIIALLFSALFLSGCSGEWLADIESTKAWVEIERQAHERIMQDRDLTFKMKIATMEDERARQNMMAFYEFAPTFLIIVVPFLTFFGSFYIHKKAEVGKAFRSIEADLDKLKLTTIQTVVLALPESERSAFINKHPPQLE